MSRGRIAVILCAAFAFWLAHLFEALLGREDWPLSGYPMYSERTGPIAVRNVMMGVSDEREFPLTTAHTRPFSGGRLKVLVTAMRGDRRARFFRELGEHYDEQRQRRSWSELHAIRVYTESWRIRPRLARMDKPVKALLDAVYLPSAALVQRMAAEVRLEARPADALPVSADDIVVDLDARACSTRCVEHADAYASGQRFLSLRPGRGGRGSAKRTLQLPAGKYGVFLRMRSRQAPGDDSVTLELDGRIVSGKRGLGNYRRDLPEPTWVWASEAAGAPPLWLNIERPGEYRLTLSTTAAVDLDQLWLSRSRREVPNDNQSREP